VCYAARATRSSGAGGHLALRLHVELIYDAGCPNVGKTREVLSRALQEVGAPAVWTEWNTGDATCPETHRGYGSPTVLVNGKDVAPGPHPWARREDGTGPRCRLYSDGTRTLGVPPIGQIVTALLAVLGPDVV
jgi:mercuric ion transport protein